MEGIPDSEWLASMVVAAYTEKRYELGAALARLCVQATRMERSRPAPAPESAWHVVDGLPVRADQVPVYAPEHQHVQDAEQTREQEALQPAPEEAPTAVTPSARCIAPVRRVGGTMECHEVLYWVSPAAGLPAGWAHYDPRVNDHEPVADRGVPA